MIQVLCHSRSWTTGGIGGRERICFHSLSTEAREALVFRAGLGGVDSKLRIL